MHRGWTAWIVVSVSFVFLVGASQHLVTTVARGANDPPGIAIAVPLHYFALNRTMRT